MRLDMYSGLEGGEQRDVQGSSSTGRNVRTCCARERSVTIDPTESSRRSHLHDGLASPLAEHDALVLLERDAPHGLARPAQLADEGPRPEVPELDAAVVAARDDEAVVELEARDRVVVRAEPVQALERREREDDDAPVRAAGDEDVGRELELADERGVALEEGQALAGQRSSDQPCV